MRLKHTAFFLFFVFLLLPSVKAGRESVHTPVYMKIGAYGCNLYANEADCEANGCYWYWESCHDDKPPMDVCYKIIKIGDRELCMTEDNQLIMIITMSITMMGVSDEQRKNIIERIRRRKNDVQVKEDLQQGTQKDVE